MLASAIIILMKLYYARHGHTDATADSTVSKVNGEIDEPLNDEGVKQADDLSEQLKDVHFDAIISSPLKRAYQTAKIVNKYHNLPINVDPAWRERETGGVYTDLKLWTDLFNFDNHVTLENGEDLKDFFERIYTEIDKLQLNHGDETILIVAHGGVHHPLYAYVNKLPLSGNIRISSMHNCEYRIYEI